LARINLWTFRLPGLAERREDIEPNLDYELEQYGKRHGVRITFNREARTRFLNFAMSEEALWPANFRDLNAAMTRMSTLASGGRIDCGVVEEEIGRLSEAWRCGTTKGMDTAGLAQLLGADYAQHYDRFDWVQLAAVVGVCRDSKSLSDAGRRLFAVSRKDKVAPNDADRLRKYLSRFGLTWANLAQQALDSPKRNTI